MKTNNQEQQGFFAALKLLGKTTFRMLGVLLLFACRLIALVLTKIGEFLEKKLNNGNH